MKISDIIYKDEYLLCEADESPMLGMDALKGQILVHIPTEDSPAGLFLLAK